MFPFWEKSQGLFLTAPEDPCWYVADGTMSGRGVDFLESWIQKNIADADRHGKPESVNELAERCVAEAAVLEVSLDDIEPEWGSVEAVIKEAINYLGEPGAPGD